jgi:hypothetical protein
MAYTGTLEKERREHRKRTITNPALAQGGDTFEQFYQDELLDDAHRPAREIDHKALKPKSNKRASSVLSISGSGEGFKTRTERRDQFFEDHKLYREGQLQQKERIELYYVFE